MITNNEQPTKASWEEEVKNKFIEEPFGRFNNEHDNISKEKIASWFLDFFRQTLTREKEQSYAEGSNESYIKGYDETRKHFNEIVLPNARQEAMREFLTAIMDIFNKCKTEKGLARAIGNYVAALKEKQ